MPRASRFYTPGEVWHITQRCHKQEYLLKFERDRMRWRHWLYQAKKCYGLSVLNYICTSNHIHLLVRDTGNQTIAKSMQLISSRTAYEYNQRKMRKGAFWEDRYHATAIATDSHLGQCLVYVDLNMLRAGVVRHPSQWKVSGYNEIQQPPQRYRIIDQAVLIELFNLRDATSLQQYHHEWVEEQIIKEEPQRDPKWTQALAVGSAQFTEKYKEQQGVRTRYRTIDHRSETCTLKEPLTAYSNHSD